MDIEPEGPQRGTSPLPRHQPQAATFFGSLVQAYRTAYLWWIDATKRRSDQRPLRIAEMVRLLEAGHKQRLKL